MAKKSERNKRKRSNAEALGRAQDGKVVNEEDKLIEVEAISSEEEDNVEAGDEDQDNVDSLIEQDEDEQEEHADDGEDDQGNEEEEEEEEEEEGADEHQQQDEGDNIPDNASHTEFISDGKYRNKQRCLVLCSRGVTARYRHLLEDIRTLLPHHKKDAKLEPGKGQTGGIGRAVNEIAEMKSCNSVLFLECRKRADCYMWLGHTPHGPSAKLHISNIHTMDELRLTGNCMKGSRPVLSFDESFNRVPHLKLLKALLIDVFGTPRGHPKSKPFVDRVMAFYYADNKVSVVSGDFKYYGMK